MSVALQNARLFDETQSLLKETEQRATELAVINSIQEGMAAELDFQAIVDLVGDKLREVFKTGDIGIRWHDPKANMIHYVYDYEHGVRNHHPIVATRRRRHLVKSSGTRQPLVVNSRSRRCRTITARLPGADTSLFPGRTFPSSGAIACSASSSWRTTSATMLSASPRCDS